jgi:hypothetical protein
MESADEISPKFGEMLKVDKQGRYKRIVLDDPELETASVLHGLFDVMIKNADILDLCLQGPHSCTRRQLVIRLAQKYDFRRELHSIHQDLRLGLYVNKRNPWSNFELAIRIDDLDLCVDAVKKASTWVKEDQASTRGEEKFGDPLQGGGLFDIRTYSLESLKALPIVVVWALSRASHSYVKLGTEPLKKAHNELASRFYNLMKLKGEFPVMS